MHIYMSTEMVLRELSNGSWLIINLSFFLMMVRFLCYHARANHIPLWRLTFTRNRNYRVAQAALALTVYLSGAVIRAAWVYINLFLQNMGWSRDPLIATSSMLLLGAVLGVVGGLCSIRVFSRSTWGMWYWTVAGFLAFLTPMFVFALARW